MIGFSELSIAANLGIFAGGAILVWFAGTKLSIYVDLFAERTGLGKAFAGALLLGGATSLPEIATTVTASVSGAATLAGNNLLGRVVMQITVLAIIDLFMLRGKPLTLFSPKASLLMVGIMLILLIAPIGTRTHRTGPPNRDRHVSQTPDTRAQWDRQTGTGTYPEPPTRVRSRGDRDRRAQVAKQGRDAKQGQSDTRTRTGTQGGEQQLKRGRVETGTS